MRASGTVLLQKRRERLRRDVAFPLPEGVEHADQRSALPGEVMEIEQLEAAEARRAQRRLDLLFVAERLQLPRGDEKGVRLVAHVVGGQKIPEDLEVPGLEHARVFLHLRKVWVDTPLADLMADDGDAGLRHKVAIVGEWFRAAAR